MEEKRLTMSNRGSPKIAPGKLAGSLHQQARGRINVDCATSKNTNMEIVAVEARSDDETGRIIVLT